MERKDLLAEEEIEELGVSSGDKGLGTDKKVGHSLRK
jgi:hypothetical protein